jgi:diguanylate cyclase (GGDEF)-like protein
MFDEITKALSQEAFDYLLQLEVKRAVRYAFYLSVLILEADQADEDAEILRVISNLIRERMRETDLVGISRGNGHGNLFRVLLTHAEPAHAKLVGERIRTRIERQVFRIHEREEHRTVSQGGACFPLHVTDPQRLLLIAEEMLTSAKRAGGNRVYFPEQNIT